ncbi:MAG: membrane protein insertase YidC [Verrucomicrobiota bacterium]
MDRTGIFVVSICAALLVFWFFEQSKITQQQAQFAATNAPSHVVHVTVTNLNEMSSQLETAANQLNGRTAPTPIFDTNAPEKTLVLTNRHARYTFTSRGGGLKLVELLDYPETISARWTKTKTASDAVASLNTGAAAPVLAVLGDTNLVGDGNFTLSRTGDGVRAEKLLPDGLWLAKEFHLSSNYLVNASVSLKNTSDKPLALPAQEWIVGTATPMDVDDNYFSIYGGAMWFDGKKSVPVRLSYFNPSTTSFIFFPRIPKTEYREGSNNAVWASAGNQFFALLAMPKQPAGQVVALPVTLPAFSNVEQAPGAPLPQGVQTALVYPAQTLSANSNLERQIVFYAGPKEYWRLADIGAEFQNRADDVMGFGGFFGFCAKPLLLVMNWLHDVTRVGYGWVIVLITVLLRGIFWPLMAASTRSMKRMQALAPEIKALKEKYKDEPQKFTQKQMELWKKHKVNPMGGCLPMAIQMPVFIGFYTMLRSAIELRGAHFLWAADLSKPDTLFMIPGVNFPFNLLPLLMGGAMLWQSHLQPPSPGMDQTQAKLMRYLPAIFILFLYNYSSGLALYMTVSTLLGVLQTKLTKNLKDPAAPAANPALTPASKKKK